MSRQFARVIEGCRPLFHVHNSSGCWVKTKEQMDEIAALGKIKTIVSKTCTLKPFEGNPTPNFREFGNFSLNCKGMPNLGYPYYRDLWSHYSSQGITYVLSVDGADPEELLEILQDYDNYLGSHGCTTKSPKEWVEVNVSCPNKACKTEQPRLLAYDIDALAVLLARLRGLQLKNVRLLVKLAPYLDRWLLNQIALLLLQYTDILGGAVCANSIPNAISPSLTRPYAGMSGVPAKLIAQSNIAQLKEVCDAKKIHDFLLVGCGGIETREDVADYVKLGASAVQVGRAIYLEGRGKLVELCEPLLRSSY